MLTLFSAPKPFRGHISTIQLNAIRSWVNLHPNCEVILFGDEDGMAEVAKEFGIRHFPDVKINEYGTPLLSDIFEKAQQFAKHDLLTFVNCDIVLGSDFVSAVEKVSAWRQRFLMVGECWNLDVTEPLALEQPAWEEDLKAWARQKGEPRGLWRMDYFAFPRSLYQPLPPFTLGRAWFDQWLIWKARDLKAAVVDASHVVTAIHQNHDYAHVPGGINYTVHGEEGSRNLKLAGGTGHCYRISEATHRFLPTGLRRDWDSSFLLRFRWERGKIQMGAFFWWVVEVSRPLRHRLGLNMAHIKRFKALMTRQG